MYLSRTKYYCTEILKSITECKQFSTKYIGQLMPVAKRNDYAISVAVIATRTESIH